MARFPRCDAHRHGSDRPLQAAGLKRHRLGRVPALQQAPPAQRNLQRRSLGAVRAMVAAVQRSAASLCATLSRCRGHEILAVQVNAVGIAKTRRGFPGIHVRPPASAKMTGCGRSPPRRLDCIGGDLSARRTVSIR
jgi:hypothetical protein